MAGRPKDDPVAQFFAKAAEAVGEVTRGAIPDIRHKLVDEAWFGRRAYQGEQDMSARLGWTKPDAEAPGQAWDDLCKRLEQERGAKTERETEHDHDFGE
jgi:hypothetical protein